MYFRGGRFFVLAASKTADVADNYTFDGYNQIG